MREMPGVALVRVKTGDAVIVPCPNGCGPSLTFEWLMEGSNTIIGHWLACLICRPAGVWSCSFCPDLIEPDGEAIWTHMAETHG